MRDIEQKVEIYSNISSAKRNIEYNIRNGWWVHTCTAGYDGVLVIYERELEIWN